MEAKPREVRLYQTERGNCPFERWLAGLKDARARAIIRERIARMMLGNFGDSKSVDDGVFESRIDYGPGYRVYFAHDGPVIVVLLCGGSKQSQRSDIATAKRFWADYRRLTKDA